MAFLAACQHQAGSSGAVGSVEPGMASQTQACTVRGGQFSEIGTSGTFICIQKTDDANQSCSASTDCEGLCLARSRTCAPVTPMFGCNEVLGKLGARSTICLN